MCGAGEAYFEREKAALQEQRDAALKSAGEHQAQWEAGRKALAAKSEEVKAASLAVSDAARARREAEREVAALRKRQVPTLRDGQMHRACAHSVRAAPYSGGSTVRMCARLCARGGVAAGRRRLPSRCIHAGEAALLHGRAGRGEDRGRAGEARASGQAGAEGK